MTDLRKRFGQMVAAHRRRRGLTQEQLAEAADVSSDMITKIETGVSGARFPVIERLAAALGVDPAEFFSSDLSSGSMKRRAYLDLSMRLANLTEADLTWLSGIVDAALAPRGGEPTAPPRPVSPATKARGTRSGA